MTDNRSPDRVTARVAARRERLIDGLDAYRGAYDQLRHRFAEWLGLYSTDAAALLEVAAAEERGEPLSPSRLGERIRLSSGATTTLLNRLEEAGHIVRTREHADRRIVTLHTSDHTQQLADRFFTPLADRLDATVGTYDPEVFDQLDALLGAVADAMRAHLAQGDPET